MSCTKREETKSPECRGVEASSIPGAAERQSFVPGHHNRHNPTLPAGSGRVCGRLGRRENGPTASHVGHSPAGTGVQHCRHCARYPGLWDPSCHQVVLARIGHLGRICDTR